MIPKIVHYVWLGNGEQSETVKKCIESWHTHLVGYQFICWNESNYNIDDAPRFVQDAYNNKKWAFASDYIRLKALYEHGGIYLDTDTEVKKPLDEFLLRELFIGMQVFQVEKSKGIFEQVANLSIGVIGSVAGHPYLKACMDAIAASSFVLPDGTLNTKVSNYTMSLILQNSYGFVVKNEQQILDGGITVYPSSIFADRLDPNPSSDCYTYHWGEMSWFQPKPRGLFFRVCWNLNLMGLYRFVERVRKK